MTGPLSVAALDAVLRAKGGPPEAWPEVVEVHEASGGNPYFALELAAALGAHGRRRGSRQPLPVPGSLRPLVQRRLAALSPAGQEVALVAAAAAAPTVGVVLAACGNDQAARHGLDSAEEAGVLSIDDDRVRFAHPLLRSVHYASATGRQRRRAHQRLAEVTGAAEAQVRHLALAADGPAEQLAARLPRPPRSPASAGPRSPGRNSPTWHCGSPRRTGWQPACSACSTPVGSIWPPSTPKVPENCWSRRSR
jgi:hypothetical protein